MSKQQPEDFSLAMCEMAWTNLTGPAKIFRQSVLSYRKDHPTQKPEELMAWCMKYAEPAFVQARQAEFEAEPPRGLRPAPLTRSERNARATTGAAAAAGLKRGARTMLEALATAGPGGTLSRQALSTRAGIKMGGTFSDYLSALRTRGLVAEHSASTVTITQAGLDLVGPDVTPLTRARVLARHASRLKAGARRMFDVLAHRAHTRAELAEKAGIKMGGTFSDYLSSLRTAGLIEESGGFVQWSDTFRALR